MRRLLSLLLLACSCSTVQAADAVFVKLKPVVVLDHAGPVRLVELAELTGSTSGAVVAAGRLVVLSDFRGPQKTIAQTEIQDALAPALVSLGIRLTWSADHEIEIRMARRRVALDAAIEQGAVELVRYFAQGRQLGVSVHDPVPPVALPPGHTTMTPVVRRLQRTGDLVELPIDIVVNGELLASPVVRYQLRYADAGSTPTNNPRSKRVSANDGVVRDAHVRIISTSGAIRLESQGRAQADAARGELVSVRRSGSQAALLARVVDAETVMVETP